MVFMLRFVLLWKNRVLFGKYGNFFKLSVGLSFFFFWGGEGVYILSMLLFHFFVLLLRLVSGFYLLKIDLYMSNVRGCDGLGFSGMGAHSGEDTGW